MKTLLAGEWRAFGRDRSGAATLESTLLGALVAIIVLSTITEIGTHATTIIAENADSVCEAVKEDNQCNVDDDDDDQGEDDDDQG